MEKTETADRITPVGFMNVFSGRPMAAIVLLGLGVFVIAHARRADFPPGLVALGAVVLATAGLAAFGKTKSHQG